MALTANKLKEKRQSRQETAIGVGWRPQLAEAIERRHDLAFIELMAEDFCPHEPLPKPVETLIERGVEVLLHSTTLSLGGAQLPSQKSLERLSNLAQQTHASLISDHIAFVRTAHHDSGHLLPVKKTEDMLAVLTENVEQAKRAFSVPLVLENIATLFEWPDPEMSESQFISQLLLRTDTQLLLDVSNLYANSINHKLQLDVDQYLAELPLDRIAYVHIAGGKYSRGLYHDTHCDPVPNGVIDLLRKICKLTHVPKVMVEIDDRFPNELELNKLLDSIGEAVA